MKNSILVIPVFFLGYLFLTAPAMAHVVVKPNQAGVAAYQTFTVGVPNEKDIPTVSVRLLIPEGIKSVTPNVKPGWKIEVKKEGEGENAVVKEISWIGGSIPEGQRDEFLYSAQVPSSPTTIAWKAYQTYSDGTVVSWDQEPNADMTDDQREQMEKENLGPLSQTKIVDDLSTSQTTNEVVNQPTSGNKSLGISLVALALSALAIGMQLRKSK